MNWPSFLAGAFCGAVLFDVLWRLTFRMADKVLEGQRARIATLEQIVELENT